MNAKAERPRLTAHRESIVPELDAQVTAVNVPTQTHVDTSTRTHVNKHTPPRVDTATVSVRVPAELAEEFTKEMRRLHFVTGASKGAIAAAMLRAAIAASGDVETELSGG